MAKREKIPGAKLALKLERLHHRVAKAEVLLEQCRICPRKCGVNRMQEKTGFCGIGKRARVASFGPHFGEESVLVGAGGSGAIFFSGCNLKCVFCQNSDISMIDTSVDASYEEVDSRQLAEIMMDLQGRGCRNINLVTPSHVIPQILGALYEALTMGLCIPVVYNTSGYDLQEALGLLEGIIDIYMPDFKFWKEDSAGRYLHAKDYPQVARRAIREMHRQVGDLEVDTRGEAVRGLLVRHLVMPGLVDETEAIMKFLAKDISPETYVNVMDQYRPCYRAGQYPEINRLLHVEEYNQAMDLARKAGLHRFEQRDLERLLDLLKNRQK